MNKHDFIYMLNSGNEGILIYRAYNEECRRKGVTPLDQSRFFTFFNIWPLRHQAVEKLVQHYIVLFDVHTLTRADGTVLKYL